MRKIFSIILLFPLLVLANTENKNDDFNNWKNKFIEEVIKEYKVDPTLAKEVIGDSYYISSPISSSKNQKEFKLNNIEYLQKRLSPIMIELGKKKYQEYYEKILPISQKYGVPVKYIISFWGLETSWGNFTGNIDIFNAYISLIYEDNRRNFYTAQLVAALKLLEKGQITKGVKGSWAGALGHMQFIPTTWEAYAVDGNGDGIIDIINQEDDAFNSAANFLNKLGWSNSESWGYQVVLPKGFKPPAELRKNRKSIEEWKKMGIKTKKSVDFPKSNKKHELYLPLGLNGPAFILYPNFYRILNWNRSYAYALTVGVYSDIISGVDYYDVLNYKIKPKPTKKVAVTNNKSKTDLKLKEKYTKVQIKQLQSYLKNLNLYNGKIDGIIGTNTKTAIKAYQQNNKLKQTGIPDAAMISKASNVNKKQP